MIAESGETARRRALSRAAARAWLPAPGTAPPRAYVAAAYIVAVLAFALAVWGLLWL